MLSRSSEYAVRALTWLAQRNDEHFHLARDIAEVLGIPAPFLGKVLQPLVAEGVLFSQRGRSGGFRLALPANEVTLQQIVLTQERLEHAHQCLLGQADCAEHDTCPLHDWWRSTSDTFLSTLENTTLADMARFSEVHPDSVYPLPLPTEMPRAPLPTLVPAATRLAASS